jgi:hypothetical protein
VIKLVLIFPCVTDLITSSIINRLTKLINLNYPFIGDVKRNRLFAETDSISTEIVCASVKKINAVFELGYISGTLCNLEVHLAALSSFPFNCYFNCAFDMPF